MSTEPNPQQRPDLEELLGAYALDATEPHEGVELEAYLGVNAQARSEVDEMREVAAMLALVVDEREVAPASLWDNIESQIRNEREQTSATSVASLDQHRNAARLRARPLRWSPVGLLATAAAVVVAVILTAAVTRSSSNSDNMSAAYSKAAKVREIMLADSVTKTSMAHVALAANGNGYVRNDGLHALPNGEIYQLWVIPGAGKAPVSVGILAATAKYTPVAVPGKFAGIAISVEKAPGAVAPSTPIASGSA